MLEAKLASLRVQTLAPERFEWCVCINGGSADEVESIRQVLQVATPFAVKVIVNEDNVPIAKARNQCAHEASGAVLLLSDDDCLLAPEVLEHHLSAQQEQLAVYVGSILFQAGMLERFEPRRADYGNVNGANTSLPKAAFEAVNGFSELPGYGGEDILLGYKLKRQGVSFKPLARASVTHLGANPMRAGDMNKARSAGRNAVIMGGWYPDMRVRLGVHPLLLRVKHWLFMHVLARPLRTLWRRLDAPSYDYERAYFAGAWEEWHVRHPIDTEP
jgi:glycosyltransferase involved in cell wall biosynthesis